MQEKVRHQLAQLLDYIVQQGFVPVGQIMEELGLSKSTANRYLNVLEADKKVRRLYGGVMACTPAQGGLALLNAAPNHSELARIGRYAADLVEDNDVIFVGTGMTCFELYRCLRAKNLTVFTNSIYCAAHRNPDVARLYVLGGEALDDNVILGSLCIENMAKINPSKIFFSASGINENYEIQYQYDVERQYLETLTAMRGEKICLVDSSKLNKQSVFNFNGLYSVQTLITDIKMSPEDIENIQTRGTHVITV